ncbi:MAG TPA: 4-(cytidine 5'-diphospho)-2-C-methyl-D-erythritol kinase [Acidimicrobiia bacterium]|nr:4-(cytidine 5'-diphospho)-2-C-methyl-D-erythritol kinase [Acidimicrobiia bacterium]
MKHGHQYTHEPARAKLTLSLRVVGLLPDGYHALEALTVALDDPADEVMVEVRQEPGVELLVEPAGSAPVDDTNLAVRAATAVLERAGAAGARIGLHKAIPMGAGLGGGSADAGAVLRVLGRALRVPSDDLHAIAASLGADVAFCFAGQPAWMRGRGDDLEPVVLPAALPVVVATPPFGCSTPAVYRSWDELGGPRDVRLVAAPAALAPLTVALTNDLEPAAERLEPRLVSFRRRFEAAIERPALLCGSGSSYAAVFDDEPSWQRALERARQALGTRRVWGTWARPRPI